MKTKSQTHATHSLIHVPLPHLLLCAPVPHYRLPLLTLSTHSSLSLCPLLTPSINLICEAPICVPPMRQVALIREETQTRSVSPCFSLSFPILREVLILVPPLHPVDVLLLNERLDAPLDHGHRGRELAVALRLRQHLLDQVVVRKRLAGLHHTHDRGL